MGRADGLRGGPTRRRAAAAAGALRSLGRGLAAARVPLRVAMAAAHVPARLVLTVASWMARAASHRAPPPPFAEADDEEGWAECS